MTDLNTASPSGINVRLIYSAVVSSVVIGASIDGRHAYPGAYARPMIEVINDCLALVDHGWRWDPSIDIDEDLWVTRGILIDRSTGSPVEPKGGRVYG